MDKDFILSEVRRTAIDGRPLGSASLESQTGIRAVDWQRFWPRIGDLHREAGLEPNQLVTAHDNDFLLTKYAELALRLGHLPVTSELKIERRKNREFPDATVFRKRWNKAQLVRELARFSESRIEYCDVVLWCQEWIEEQTTKAIAPKTQESIDGYVYLIKAKDHCKIGATADWEQRSRQIQLHNAHEVGVIHIIRTDDPFGVEAYWHRRFKAKRVAVTKSGKQRKWYKLSADDVRAFKRWKQI